MCRPLRRRSGRLRLFREHDERLLIETHAIAQDEQKLIQTQQETQQELMNLFESDQSED